MELDQILGIIRGAARHRADDMHEEITDERNRAIRHDELNRLVIQIVGELEDLVR